MQNHFVRHLLPLKSKTNFMMKPRQGQLTFMISHSLTEKLKPYFTIYFYFPCYSFLMFFSSPDMRRDVQEIFRSTPHEKQVMMFSATLSKDVRPVCKKFMQDVRSSYQNKQHFSYFSQKASSIPPNSTVTTQTVQKVFSKTSQHLYCQPILKCSFSSHELLLAT